MEIKNVKQKSVMEIAHMLTLVCVCYCLVSLFGVMVWQESVRMGTPRPWASCLPVWGVHVALIAVTVWVWRKEKPQSTLWFGEDDELVDAKPEEINLVEQKVAMKKSLIAHTGTSTGVAATYVFAVLMRGQALSPRLIASVLIFFGGFWSVGALAAVLKYWILKRRVATAQKQQ
jgi:hypothetical protein